MILVSFLPYIDSSPAYVGAVIVLISACVGAVIAVDKVLLLCYFKIHSLGWSSRHSCPPEIQLQSRRTGAVLMRRVKDFQETCFTKLAQNNIHY